MKANLIIKKRITLFTILIYLQEPRPKSNKTNNQLNNLPPFNRCPLLDKSSPVLYIPFLPVKSETVLNNKIFNNPITQNNLKLKFLTRLTCSINLPNWHLRVYILKSIGHKLRSSHCNRA